MSEHGDGSFVHFVRSFVGYGGNQPNRQSCKEKDLANMSKLSQRHEQKDRPRVHTVSKPLVYIVLAFNYA